MDCIFCEIVNKKLPAEIIYEDEEVIAFLDLNPINYGHTLVVSKEHYENFLEIPEDLFKSISGKMKKLAVKLQQGLNAEGFNVVINTGRPAGQTIFHFHYHIIPRYKNDEIKFIPKLKKYSRDEFRTTGEELRKIIKNEV